MGNGALRSQNAKIDGMAENLCFQVLLNQGSYIRQATLSLFEIEVLRESWKLILNNTAPGFHNELLRIQKDHHCCPMENVTTCRQWFVEVYHNRLVTICPDMEHFFYKGYMTEARTLKFYDAAIVLADQKAFFDEMMTTYALRDCVIGIRPIEYGYMGEALFYALSIVLGECYNDIVWRKLFSVMLDQLIPKHIEYVEHLEDSSNCRKAAHLVDVSMSITESDLQKIRLRYLPHHSNNN